MTDNFGSSVLKTGPQVREPLLACFPKPHRGFPEVWVKCCHRDTRMREGEGHAEQSDFHLALGVTCKQWYWVDLKQQQQKSLAQKWMNSHQGLSRKRAQQGGHQLAWPTTCLDS